MRNRPRSIWLAAMLPAVVLVATAAFAQSPALPANADEVFRRENLIAWCIVPFDAKRRGPEERAAMLARLGFKHFAYDYRAEHVPTFEAEIAACKRHGVALDAWWFPGTLNDEARHILDVCQRTGIHPQLWISGGGEPTRTPEEQSRRVDQEAARIRPIAEAAAAQQMKVGLYNHGGWFGEPENQLAVIERLKLPNVGIVYNLHHGHDHVDRLPEILKKTLPHLLAINLNGMNRGGDRNGQKILQLGQGELDLSLLRTIRDSGYRGPIGILGHTQNDAETQLQDNLDGLDWLLPQLDGKPAGVKLTPRTPVPKATGTGSAATEVRNTGFAIEGRSEYRSPPLTVELRATLNGKQRYNILVACDTKASAAHWEIFTMPGSGWLTAYLPGMKPDHVRSAADICDGKPHDIAMTYEANLVRLFLDGKMVAEQAIESKRGTAVAGALAIGRLVEGSFGCDGMVHSLRLSRGIRTIGVATSNKPETGRLLVVDENTVGLWNFASADVAEVNDLSSFKNNAKRTAAVIAGRPAAPVPTAGPHLKPVDPRLKVVLLDRSPNEVYMGVKVDESGNIFVGGRNGVFVFEALANGDFGPRREVLRFPPDSIIMGLEFRNDDLYVVTDNALYLVPGGRVKHAELQPQRILWGIPLDSHVSFHCLAWGPEGDLYLTHGDPLLQYGDWTRPDHWGHWTLFCGQEGKPLPYTGQGAVLRMKPDGTDVRVVATGLRGPVGLAFDKEGNLFTNDNDHESRADQYAPSRLLHVLQGADFAWPRGWMASKSPDRFDLIEPVCDLGRGVPCDLTYYGSEYLPDTVRDRLLMCRWDRHAVTAYKPVPRGVSFRAAEETILEGDDNCRPVGIAAGKDGRLFVTSLYMTGNVAIPDCFSDLVMVTRTDNAAPTETGRVNAKRQHVAGLSIQSTSEPLDDARSDDPYRRQLGVSELARTTRIDRLKEWSQSSDQATRLAAILATGRKLTVPDPHFVPPTKLDLFDRKATAYFNPLQQFYGSGEKIDLTKLGRVGSFTTAQWWAAIDHTPEQETLFSILITGLDDQSERVRLQAAYYLSLLKDPRTEPLIEKARRDVQLKRLRTAQRSSVQQAWALGPFDDGDDPELTRPHPPQQTTTDLTATYPTDQGRREWVTVTADNERFSLPNSGRARGQRGSTYVHFRVHSSSRQTGLLELTHAGLSRVWLNGAAVGDRVPIENTFHGMWFVDLQPGSNDFLLRLQSVAADTSASTFSVELRATSNVDLTLPEKLDSALLASRLREAAGSGGANSPGGEFLSINWEQALSQGDAAEGRKLFGSLGCSKCHAIVPDQKSAGAPSLFEAKRRFTVPHLVESILLPSRTIAEPFRGQSFVTNDGKVWTGLVVSENADTIELLLPDASRRTLSKLQIEERGPTPISPMPQALVRTPDELRHLLAYLLSERPNPP